MVVDEVVHAEQRDEAVARGHVDAHFPLLGADLAAQRINPYLGQVAHSVSSVPSNAVIWLESTPPLPCASATLAFFTWRAPVSPRNCRTASTSRKIPYMPGWTHDRPPPFVLTASAPPGAMRPPETKAPPSPLAQKPRSSRKRIVLMVKAS